MRRKALTSGRRETLKPRAPAPKGAYTYRWGAATATLPPRRRYSPEELRPSMRYIDHILQPGETVAYTTTLHWIVYLPAMGLWLLAFVVLAAGGAAGPVAL